MLNSKIILSEKHQKVFGKPLGLRVKNKTGPDHFPTFTVEYITYWGTFEKTGDPGEYPQTVAEKLAAEILSELI